MIAPAKADWRDLLMAAGFEDGDAHTQTRLGAVEAATEAEAIEKAANEFTQYAAKLMAAMTRHKGENTRADVQRNWPHHIALTGRNCQGLDHPTIDHAERLKVGGE